jgi:hypothetical protein
VRARSIDTLLVSTSLFLSSFALPPVSPAYGYSPGDILSLPFVGEKKFLFMRVEYPGDTTEVLTEEGVLRRAELVKDAFLRNSYGRVRIEYDVTPVLTMPHPRSYYEGKDPLVTPALIRRDASAMARLTGFPLEDYDREIIYSAKIWDGATGIGTINTRTVFLSGGNAYLDVHELGHSLDWQHADFWKVLHGNSPISPDGARINYGDPFDIMGDQGWGQHSGREFHHFNPWYKTRAGWIPPENVLTVTQSGIYWLQPYEQPPSEEVPVERFTALRIPRDAEKDYWVFWRREEPLVSEGVVITWGYHTNMRPSVLLDMTPHSQPDDWKDPALAVGHTFWDDEADIEITVLEKRPEAMKLQIDIRRSPPDQLPVINVVKPSRGQTVRGPIEYAATAYDPDEGNTNGSGIARLLFELVRVEPPQRWVVVASREFTRTPYSWSFDTSSLPTSVYFLTVTATSVTGESNTVWFPHIIDNSPSDKVPSGPLWSYPNPFGQTTRIQYVLDASGFVNVSIHDVLGRRLETLVSEHQHPGTYSLEWRPRGLPAGVYFCRMEVRGRLATTKRILLLR